MHEVQSSRFSSSSSSGSHYGAADMSFNSGSSSSSSSGGKFRASHCCLATLSGHESSVFSLAASQDALFSGSEGNQILVWQQQQQQQPQQDGVFFSMSQVGRFGQGDGCVKALLAIKEKKLIFSAHQDNKIRVWRHDDSAPPPSSAESKIYKLSATLPTVTDYVRNCMLPKNYVRVRRHKSRLWIQHSDTISSLARSPNAGGVIYSCSWDRTVKVWRMSDLRCLESFKAHDDAINAIATHGGFVYTGSADSKIKVWKECPTTNKHVLVSVLNQAEEQRSSVNALVLSADGDHGCVLYSGMSDSRIVAWESEDGGGSHMRLLESLKGHRLSVLCLAAAGGLLCSGSADRSVRVWRRDGTSGGMHSCLGVLNGHSGPVKAVAVVVAASSGALVDESGSDVFRVYSGGLDRQIKVWRVGVAAEPSSPATSSSEEDNGSSSRSSSSLL